MKIAVIGSGYVGTVTGTCLAELGHSVICSDVNEERIGQLSKGDLPNYEPGLESLIRTNLEEGRLQFTTNNKMAVEDADVVFICIGTPLLPNGKPDIKPLETVIEEVAQCLKGHTLIVEKSTLPIRAGEWLEQKFRHHLSKGADIDVAAVPQFLREGFAVQDFMKPDRIVIGANAQQAIDTLIAIYQPLCAPMVVTDINSAELIKHASNAFLAMKISFINSMAHICERTGADVDKVAKGIGLDSRISAEFLNAGVGYGGIFFPKDITSLVSIADEYSINLDLLKSTETVNRYQRIRMIEKIEYGLSGNLSGKTIAVWGLAYRPNTNDLRDAPSITIMRSLEKRGAKLKAFDPMAMSNAKSEAPHVTYCADPYEAAVDADAIVILTEWNEFQQINFRRLKEMSNCRVIVDGRNLFKPQRMADLGFRYVSVGRPVLEPKANAQVPGKPPTRESKDKDTKKPLEKV